MTTDDVRWLVDRLFHDSPRTRAVLVRTVGLFSCFAGIHMLFAHALPPVSLLLLFGGAMNLVPRSTCPRWLTLPRSLLLYAAAGTSLLAGLYIGVVVREWYVGIPVMVSGVLNYFSADTKDIEQDKT